MSALLYYSISSNLTEDEIDRQVANNRKTVYVFVRKLPANSKRKAKRLFVYTMILFSLGQPLVPCAIAIVTPLPPIHRVNRLSPSEESRVQTQKRYLQTAPIPASKVDKIRLTKKQIKQFNSLAYQLSRNLITTEEAILQLRVGDGVKDIVVILAFYAFVKWWESVYGFQAVPLPHMDPVGWMRGKYDPSYQSRYSRYPSAIQITRLPAMPHQDFVDLTKEERRALPHNDDMKITCKGYPELRVGFYQSKFKVTIN